MRRYWIFILMVMLGCTVCVNIFTQWFYTNQHGPSLLDRLRSYHGLGPLFGFTAAPPRFLNSATPIYVVDTPGCRIPAMDPFDPLIKMFIKKVTPIDCAANSSPQLVKSNLTSLYVDQAALAYYNVSDTDQLECCYRPFWRVDGDMSNYSFGVDDEIRHDTKCTPFKNEVLVNTEFVTVECIMNDQMYRDFYAFTPLTMTTEQRFQPRWSHIKDSLSVLIIGIDGVSRLNFHRQMPLTEAFLRENDAIEMTGYNILADNTFPNLIPVLSGMTEEELMKTCWKADNASFDSCPWIWKNYSDAGYMTAFGEDTPGTEIFNYCKTGFVLKPTDYFMRPYMKEYEDYVGHPGHVSNKPCIGPRSTHEVFLEYVNKFAQTMEKIRYFGFFWGGSLFHDSLNYPQLGDSLHERTLRQLADVGALDRTLLIVMSDHGMRWGPIRGTYQGRLEERLPLLFFMFPAWFRDWYSPVIANLRENRHRLTTPFDLHATLLHVLNLATLNKESLESRMKTQVLKPALTGVSLFRPVSSKRTCNDAGIPTHWCACHHKFRSLSLTSVAVQKVARALVKYLNDLLYPFLACARLKLRRVLDARRLSPSNQSKNITKIDVQKGFIFLVVQTQPGNALFEATIHETKDNTMKISGTVSRVNDYEEQSSCIDDLRMKLYCYCKELIKEIDAES